MTTSSRTTSRDRATLTIDDLCVTLASPAGPVVALDHVSAAVEPGTCLAVIGESGSGKSTLARACLGFLPRRDALVTGRVVFEGVDLLGRPEHDLRRLRGRLIGFVGQDSYAAFDSLFTIGRHLREALAAHADDSGAPRRLGPALERVGLDPGVLQKYPHELSGGMLQRVQIAAALLHGPSLVVADEPTSALDPVRRAEVAALLDSARRETGAAMVLATHDLALASRLADRVLVVHRGRPVESGEPWRVLADPRDPITARLVEAARRTAPAVASGGLP